MSIYTTQFDLVVYAELDVESRSRPDMPDHFAPAGRRWVVEGHAEAVGSGPGRQRGRREEKSAEHAHALSSRRLEEESSSPTTTRGKNTIFQLLFAERRANAELPPKGSNGKG